MIDNLIGLIIIKIYKDLDISYIFIYSQYLKLKLHSNLENGISYKNLYITQYLIDIKSQILHTTY